MSIKLQSFNPGKSHLIRLQGYGIAFAIPFSRLVAVHYMRGTTKQVATIINPRSNASLQIAMLQRHVAMSQVRDVCAVQEYAPPYGVD